VGNTVIAYPDIIAASQGGWGVTTGMLQFIVSLLALLQHWALEQSIKWLKMNKWRSCLSGYIASLSKICSCFLILGDQRTHVLREVCSLPSLVSPQTTPSAPPRWGSPVTCSIQTVSGLYSGLHIQHSDSVCGVWWLKYS